MIKNNISEASGMYKKLESGLYRTKLFEIGVSLQGGENALMTIDGLTALATTARLKPLVTEKKEDNLYHHPNTDNIYSQNVNPESIKKYKIGTIIKTEIVDGVAYGEFLCEDENICKMLDNNDISTSIGFSSVDELMEDPVYNGINYKKLYVLKKINTNHLAIVSTPNLSGISIIKLNESNNMVNKVNNNQSSGDYMKALQSMLESHLKRDKEEGFLDERGNYKPDKLKDSHLYKLREYMAKNNESDEEPEKEIEEVKKDELEEDVESVEGDDSSEINDNEGEEESSDNDLAKHILEELSMLKEAVVNLNESIKQNKCNEEDTSKKDVSIKNNSRVFSNYKKVKENSEYKEVPGKSVEDDSDAFIAKLKKQGII